MGKYAIVTCILAILSRDISSAVNTCTERPCHADGNEMYSAELRDDYMNIYHENDQDESKTSEAPIGEDRTAVNIDADDIAVPTETDALPVNDEEEFEFPALTRIKPGKVGDVVDIELEPGKIYHRITRALNPPVFEIPDYLTELECDLIIKLGQYTGLEKSGVLGSDIEKEFERESLDLSRITRVSNQTFLSNEEMPSNLWNNLVYRLSKLVDLPVEIITISEDMQVVSYSPGGHYHAHLDTSLTSERGHVTCCRQAPECYDLDTVSPDFEECCRVCRYITVLYYLNDVEEGGETAFPLADIADKIIEERATKDWFQNWMDLSHFCHDAPLVVKPKRGTAIMWYNHFIDPETGYLGDTDLRSYHGGCDIIRGSKWIANNWITAIPYRDRKIPIPT